MKVTVYEKGNRVSRYENVIKIERKTYHIFILESDYTFRPHELEDVERIEVEL
jgi:hypothetical protein